MNKPTLDEIRNQLKDSIDEAEWSWLRPHLERQAVVVVSQDLCLLDVGVKIAIDEVESVRSWIAEEKIAKPSDQQLKTWEANSNKRFSVLIVQPYVLVQEKAN